MGGRGTYGKAQRERASGKRPSLGPGLGAPRSPDAPDASQDANAPASSGDWRGAVQTTVAGLGYDLVDIERAQRGLLRVTIDRLPGHVYAVPGDMITVEDCEQVTRQLQYVLEVEGLDYARLEVSSPGLDRPLKTEDDFRRFAGQAVSVTLKQPFRNRKTWQGVLAPAAEGQDGWSLTFQDGKAEQVLGFRFDEVREARLVPVLNFKGRKQPDAVQQADPAADDAAAQGG